MKRFIEFILGLDRDVLGQQGEYSLTFDPVWPFAAHVPAAVWNLLLAAGICYCVWRIYRREVGSQRLRLFAGAIRLVVLLLVLVILNRPMLSLTQTRTEPSVLAVLIDQSLSMQVADVADGGQGEGRKNVPRLMAVQRLMESEGLLGELARKHTLRFYRFAGGATPLAEVSDEKDLPGALKAIAELKADGQSTMLRGSIQQVMQQMQGQRLAGVVVFTDGREMPAQSDAQAFAPGAIYPIPVGSESRVRNVAIRSVSAQDVVFRGDLVSVRCKVAVTGADASDRIRLSLKRSDGSALPSAGGRDASSVLAGGADGTYETDIVFPAIQAGTLDLVLAAEELAGEITSDDNSRALQINVLDAQVNLLYVDGYPRWEYRYLRTQMMRDKSVQISTLLTGADPDYLQEGDRPIRYFPTTMDQLLEYDVVIFGDVDPRQFTDTQLQMVREFVMNKGGGFGMVAGPRFSPQAWRGTPIEPVLPVDIVLLRPDDSAAEPFRPAVTAEGQESPIFRFFADRAVNEAYIRQTLPPLYWYARGVTARTAVAEVYAEHPSASGPDGRRAPLLVAGRPGAGRSLFSAIDDSWRWRYYTGESIFDTYWVQQIRFLARGRKVGQRRISFASVQPVYELGQQVQLELRVLDDALLTQLPESVGVEVSDADGKLVARENLHRGTGARKDVYRALLPAAEVGRFVAKLPSPAAGVDPAQATFDVLMPRLELSDPTPARPALAQMAAGSDGRVIELSAAAKELLSIPSAARMLPVQTSWRLWSSALLLGLLVTLLTLEWVARKWAGLV